MQAYSLLDLAPINQGSTARDALLNALDLARHAETLGYRRFWMAEHHNMTGIASAATPVALGFIAAGTEHIRVGAAGMMLPNHAPLVVAEEFGTLEALYPGRVDLGLGRAPGTDQETLRALRRDHTAANRFPQDVEELIHYLEPVQPGQRIQAVPGAGTRVPVWILGSSLFGAQLAAAMGLPYAFASHFAPDMLDEALQVYRTQFQPSRFLETPYAAAAINVFASDDETEARRLMTSMEQQFIALTRGTPGPLQPPVDDPDSLGNAAERRMARHALKESAVGTPRQVDSWINGFLERTAADEIIVTGQIHDHEPRKRSFEIASRALEHHLKQ
ncbi:luciferase family oxidoreductase group 1 [Halospina denitrificans]|uniref:Luciferase-like monooxygenase n=1 Tax=Halospina denitrificans TaxID=332522 RepID=A0A4R7JXC7_9GAMM|nr:LLM class flavin-dependent oxidoreductase [Halospina denitrificans]TDT43111.1 luciferase family oxidoreductase group 1 [Halospina denitrificans]